MCRICPLNFDADMMSASGVLKDRVRTGASLADVDPMEIDKSVSNTMSSTLYFETRVRSVSEGLHIQFSDARSSGACCIIIAL